MQLVANGPPDEPPAVAPILVATPPRLVGKKKPGRKPMGSFQDRWNQFGKQWCKDHGTHMTDNGQVVQWMQYKIGFAGCTLCAKFIGEVVCKPSHMKNKWATFKAMPKQSSEIAQHKTSAMHKLAFDHLSAGGGSRLQSMSSTRYGVALWSDVSLSDQWKNTPPPSDYVWTWSALRKNVSNRACSDLLNVHSLLDGGSRSGGLCTKPSAGRFIVPKMLACMAEVIRQDLRRKLGNASDISISADGKGVVESVNLCCVDQDSLHIHHAVLGLGSTDLTDQPGSGGLDTAMIPKYQKMVHAIEALIKRFCSPGYIDLGCMRQHDGVHNAVLERHVKAFNCVYNAQPSFMLCCVVLLCSSSTGKSLND